MRPEEPRDRPGSGWFTVRCVFAVGGPLGEVPQVYEERVTLWRAGSMSEAIARAEAEAAEYASSFEDDSFTYLGLAQSYAMADKPVDGAEVYSLMRDSALPPGDYLERFFDTGDEREGAE